MATRSTRPAHATSSRDSRTRAWSSAGQRPCPAGGPPLDDPWITTDQDVYLSGHGTIHATYQNRGTETLHGNKCSNGPEWEFQLQLERLVDGDWVLVHDPVTLSCLGPREIAGEESVAFKGFSVGAESGTSRLVWPRVTVSADSEELPILEQRTSSAFSIVEP